MMPLKNERDILSVITQMLGEDASLFCAKPRVICLQFRLVTISIAKTKAEPLAEFSASVVNAHFVWETE